MNFEQYQTLSSPVAHAPSSFELCTHMTILLATANAHKIEEISAMLRNIPHLEIVDLRELGVVMPPETGSTMRENARIKARSVMQQTGLISLADDSGIEVDILDGEPGVRSARWINGSDDDRTLALLARVDAAVEAANATSSTRCNDEMRTARYRCAICVAFPDGKVLETEGTCEGRIAHAPRGENGFGYDPIFEITPATGAPIEYSNCTMAEVSSEVKAQVSHRARAITEMVKLLTKQSDTE